MKKYQSYRERKNLFDQLPLDRPLGVHVTISSHCNFKCFYCKHSMDTIDSEKGKIVGESGWLNRDFMSMDVFNSMLEQLKEFPQKLPLLQFAWMGEPLLHPHVSEMVKLAKQADVADVVSIVTNGSMLTPKMSDELIGSGLDRLRISLQGLRAEDYWNVAQYKLDYHEYLDNISYFYKHKTNTQVYIKIMDVMLKNKEDEKLFHRYFDDICDVLNVEYLVPLHNEIHMEKKSGEFDRGYFGNEAVENKICSYCFYMLVIAPDGRILPCPCSDGVVDVSGKTHNMCLGDLNRESIIDFWNGKRLYELRKQQILGKRKDNIVCAQCAYPKYHTSVEDELDKYYNELCEIYGVFREDRSEE